MKQQEINHRLRRELTALFTFAVASMASAAYADSATATAAATFAADTRSGTIRAISPCAVEYSPSWSGVTDEGAYVVIEKVEHAGMFNAVTSTVITCAADAEGGCAYAVSDGDERCVRLVHRVYSSGGEEIGEPLVRDVAFGYQSAAGAAFAADSRTNSLQETVSARKGVNLAYSTAWAANTASVSIKAVRLSGRGGAPVATNALFSAAADAEGVTAMRGVGRGWWRLLFQSADDSDDVLLEYLTDEFKIPGGFIVGFW